VFDCAGLFVDPAVIPPRQLPSLAQPLSGFAHEPLRRAFDELVEQLKALDNVAPLLTEGLAMWVLGHAAGMPRQPACDGGSAGLAPWQLRRVTDVFGANLAVNHPVEQMARLCKLSPSHFCRAFKQSTGLPPHQWVLNARVKMACDLLLHSSATLAEIASACGFSDQGHFTRTFSRLQGTSPGVWRRHHQA
jgi:AraC-like DNA-binding protein